jgi:hypothetical protein
MTRPRAAFLAAAALFLLWIAFLAYQALAGRDPLVLSRPQLLVADLVVTARVDDLGEGPVAVTVREVHYAAAGAPAPDSVIEVEGLAACRKDWAGPGLYILPLSAARGGRYRVTPTPRSPGYGAEQPRIYPATPGSEAQLRQVLRQYGKAPPAGGG